MKREEFEKTFAAFFDPFLLLVFIFSLLLDLPGNSSAEDLGTEETALSSLNDLLVH